MAFHKLFICNKESRISWFIFSLGRGYYVWNKINKLLKIWKSQRKFMTIFLNENWSFSFSTWHWISSVMSMNDLSECGTHCSNWRRKINKASTRAGSLKSFPCNHLQSFSNDDGITLVNHTNFSCRFLNIFIIFFRLRSICGMNNK